RAAVSSFGISGTNAHLILEQAPPQPTHQPTHQPTDQPAPTPPGGVPWILSGHNPQALHGQIARLRQFVVTHPDTPVTDIGYSLAVSRAPLNHRAAILATDRQQALGELEALLSERLQTRTYDGKLAFVFSGQGAQHVGMGRELAARFPVFADTFQQVRTLLHLDPDGPPPELIDQTVHAQTGLFAFEVALVDLLATWGITPDLVLGHSLGEITAAHIAGVMNLHDACALVAARAHLMQTLPPGGAMAAVQTTEAEARRLITGTSVSIAAVNGPASLVLSGPEDALTTIIDGLEQHGERVQRLRVSHAFHSSLMTPMLSDFEEALAGLHLNPPRIELISALTGQPAGDDVTSPDYWVRHVRETVRFADAVDAAAGSGVSRWVEIGPDAVLTPLIHLSRPESAEDQAVVVGAVRRERSEVESLLDAVGELWKTGADLDWEGLFAGSGGKKVPLPAYAFQRELYWMDQSSQAQGDAAGVGRIENRFWEAVERGDVPLVAETLRIQDRERESALSGLLSSLSRWRRNTLDQEKLSDWLYRVVWRPVPDESAGVRGRWVAVVPRDRGSDTVVTGCVRELRSAGGETVVVEVDTDSETGLREGLVAALRGVRDEGVVPVGVVSFLGLARGWWGGVPVGVGASLVLAQTLGEVGCDGRLWLVTSGAVSVDGREVGAWDGVVQGAVWGLGRVVGLERPDGWGGLVDVPAVVDRRTGGMFASALGGMRDEDQIAIRPQGMFVRRLVRDRSAMTHAGPSGVLHAGPSGDWWKQGSVVVTEGTGAMGAEAARWLAARGASHVVLVSRTGARAPGAEELRAELEESGCRVTIAACDVADRDRLAAVLDGLPADAPLTGIVHAADVLRGGPLESLALEDDFEDVMRSKLRGAINLHELTRGLPDLRAFVLFSSATGVWGAASQGPRAAANEFLNALAGFRRGNGLPALSVAWGAWEGEGPETDERLRRSGVRGMSPSSALLVLDSLTNDVVTVADIEWETFAPAFSAARERPLLAEIPEARQALIAAADGGEGDGEAWRSRLAELDEAGRLEVTLELVRRQAAAVLGHADGDPVSARQAFREMGFDSLAAVQLRNRLNKATGIRLSATTVFDYPTPADLTRRLLSLLDGDDPGDGNSVLDDVARLESKMLGSSFDRALLDALRDRLERIVRGMDPGRSGDEGDGGDGGDKREIADATAEEMLDLIRDEFGKQ
ncbi:SDR family NAD(P)-dependent oxidoreductase, partial [Streptomyces griseochromogenes]|uniref:SDR family NAD(P)-dependent oxidoreductase n=1 Tax=Streptomyces griseochromogenes TaxID=68214 RepID=UPI0037911284